MRTGVRRTSCVLFLFNVFELDPEPGAQAAARLLDAPQEAWVVFEKMR